MKIGRNGYHCSEFGETSFMMMSLALRRFKKNFRRNEHLGR
jgi:hypothetical protein